MNFPCPVSYILNISPYVTVKSPLKLHSESIPRRIIRSLYTYVYKSTLSRLCVYSPPLKGHISPYELILLCIVGLDLKLLIFICSKFLY